MLCMHAVPNHLRSWSQHAIPHIQRDLHEQQLHRDYDCTRSLLLLLSSESLSTSMLACLAALSSPVAASPDNNSTDSTDFKHSM